MVELEEMNQKILEINASQSEQKKMHEKELKGAKRNYEAEFSTLQKELKAVRKLVAAISPSKRGKKMERSCLASLEPAKSRKSPGR